MKILAKFGLMASAILLLCAPVSAMARACPNAPSLELRAFPDDIDCPLRRIEDFGHIGWETFKRIVWPAKMQDDKGDSLRGVPDDRRRIFDMNGPRVFETYKSDWETFQAGTPSPWHDYPSTAPICANNPSLAPGALVLASLNKFGSIDLSTRPPPGGIGYALISQNRRFVRYHIAYGEKAFNSIIDNGLNRPVGIEPSDQPPRKEQPNKTRMDEGTVTIKSAWIEITNEVKNPTDFYVRDAWVQDPLKDPQGRVCEPIKVGLVGLHIAHKTKASPQWLWMSFEHIKNAPQSGAVDRDGYTFNDGRSSMPVSPPDEARLPVDEIPIPYSVERWKAIPDPIKVVNREWRKELSQDSVWWNYELVVLQWPGHAQDESLTGSGLQIGNQFSASPTPPCLEETDANLASTVIETFVQRHTACTKRTTCMTCHNEARSYDFIWSIPIAHERADPDRASLLRRRSSISILREIVEQDMQP